MTRLLTVEQPGAWGLLTGALPGGRFTLVAFLSDLYPDGTLLGLDRSEEEFSGVTQILRLDVDDSGRPVVTFAPWAEVGLPSLWFVEMDASTPTASMHALVAFATGHARRGTVVSNAAFFTMPVRSDEQVGAVRWDTNSGEIDQVFVAEQARDQQVARTMIAVSDAYRVHRGWPGKVYVGGRRSDTVERLLEGRPATRIMPRTERTVIMDPLTGDTIE